MKKLDLKNIVSELLLNELDGILTNQSKQTKRNSILAQIKDLQQQLKDKQAELSQLR